jgi:hypothetical protein
MEEYQEEFCLHLVASRVFSDALKTGDPDIAGKAYAEFYMRFKKAYEGRMNDLHAGDEDYRYGEILQSSAYQKAPLSAQPASAGRTYDPEAARKLAETEHSSPDSFTDGRSF